MQRQRKLLILRKVLGREAFQKRDECVFFCPKCKHHKPKLSVNLDSDIFHCWICEFSGKNLKPILFLNGRTDDATEYAKEYTPQKEKKKREFDVPKLPEGFVSLTDSTRDPYVLNALSYLRKRNVNEHDLFRYKLGFCTTGEYKNRIIVPSFDSFGCLNFFVGRKIYDYSGENYKHGEFDKDIIFNDYLIDWDEDIVIVEGPFDSIIAGDNAIPLQGSSLREDSKLFSKIVTSGVNVYLALDADALDKQLDMARKFMRNDVNVSLIDVSMYGVRDVGEMTKDTFKDAKANARRVDEFDVLRMKVQSV